jgi:hypothetical protein
MLNLNNIKNIEAMGLKLLHRGPLEWHHLPTTKFHEIYQAVQNLLVGDTDRDTRLVIRETYFSYWKVG